MAITLQWVVRSTSCLILWWSFRGRRIERRFCRFSSNQRWRPAAILKNSNGHISAMGDLMYFVFGSGWGFRGRQIERRYFRSDKIQDGGRRPFWKFQMAISLQWVVRSTSCGWMGLRGRRIERRYFRFSWNPAAILKILIVTYRNASALKLS